MKKFFVISLFFIPLVFSGCFLTKVVTVPMRVIGAGVSVIPVGGNKAHDVIDEAAEVVDEVPI